MAHITSVAAIDYPSPTADWDEVQWASVNTAADGTGQQLLKDEIPNFTAVNNANVSIPMGDLDFDIPNGDMPDDEALHMMRCWLANRVANLALLADDSDFAATNGTVYVLLHTGDPGDAAANHLADATNSAGYAGGVAATIGTSGGTAADLQLGTGLAG